MLQQIFKVVISRVPPEVKLLNPLTVGVRKSSFEDTQPMKKYQSLCEKGYFIAALIKDYYAIYDSIDCVFVQIQIVEDTLCPHVIDSIPIFVTESFLEHYNLSYGDLSFFKPVVCQNLERVVYGVKSIDAFTLFQDEEAYKDILIQCCHKKILCRQNDTMVTLNPNLRLSFDDFITLECQPFCQGLVGLSTSVIVADLRDNSPVNTNEEIYIKNRPDTLPIDSTSLNLINYTSNILRRPIQGSDIATALLPTLKFLYTFEIRIIPQLDTCFQRELIAANRESDPLNTVYVSETLSKKLKLQSGSWLKVTLLEEVKVIARSPEEEGLSETVYNEVSYPVRLAQVCCFTDSKVSLHYFPHDKLVYISPLLWFNLNKQPSLLMHPEMKLHMEPLNPKFSPPFATEAHVNLVQSPNYDGKVNCTTMLSRYFDTTRFVSKGDIFCTDSREQLDFHQTIQDEEHDRLKWPVVYFRISSLEGADNTIGYLMSNKKTRLYHVGTKQSYIPVTMDEYYHCSPSHPIWSSIPEGLSHYINLLKDLISPFLKLQHKNCILSSNILLSGPLCCGKTTVIKAVCRCLNLHLYQVNCHELVGENSAVTEARLKNKTDKGLTYAPCVILLKNAHLIGKEKDSGSEDSRVIHLMADLLKKVNSYGSEWPIIVIGTTTENKLNSALMSAFLHTVHMKAPSEEERSLLIHDLLSICKVGNDVSTRYLAQRTAGFVLGDLCALVDQAVRNAYCRVRKLVNDSKQSYDEEEDMLLASIPIVQRDLMLALEQMHAQFAEALGAPKIPDVKFEDVGGLAEVKQEILDTIQLPLDHPEILFSGLRRSGVLLYGPPGSGKTMLAKAVATECSLNFLSVKGPELINKYVGQSEENVRAVFGQARSAVPCIIFFDELDSLAPNRGRSGDSGGVMDRVVSQLLSELDGLNKKSEVFVIGATNRPDLIDPALLRPGRFDRLLYVGIPEDKESKIKILKALTRKIPLAESVKLEEIVEKCPDHLSGADFYSLCSNAVIKRIEKNVDLVEKGEKSIAELDPAVQTEDFLQAMASVQPSVTVDQFRQYQDLKMKIENN